MNERIVSKNFILVFLAQLFNTIIMYMLMTTLADYASELGATLTVAGLVTGIYIIGAILSRLIAGMLMEVYGWKKIGLIFSMGQLIGCMFYFVSNNIVLLIATRFIHGFFFGGASSAIISLGSAMLPKSRYSEATGYFLLASTLAMGIGPYVGGIIFDNMGPVGCFIGASTCSFLVLATLLLLDARNVDPCGKNRDAALGSELKGIDRLLDKRAIPISICETLAAISFASVMSFYRPYGEQLGLSTIFSYFFLIYSGTLIVSRPLAGRLQDKKDDNIVIYPAAVIQTIGLILFALVPNHFTTILCAISVGLGFGTLTSIINAMACKMCPENRRSYAVATYWALNDIGTGFGPSIMGTAANVGGYSCMYLVAACTMLCMIPYYYMVWGKYNHKT